MKVKDVMHKGVDWVSPNTPVTELAKLMREHDIGCIPIGEDERLIGMVTDRDIVCNGLASNNFDAGRTMARDVMTEGIHCCREDDDLAKAVHHMEKLKEGRGSRTQWDALTVACGVFRSPLYGRCLAGRRKSYGTRALSLARSELRIGCCSLEVSRGYLPLP